MEQKVTAKKVFIRTLGCQMNNRDSEVICGLLQGAGFEIVLDAKAADVVIFNTCSVRQHAEDRVWSEIGWFAKEREKTEKGTGVKKLKNDPLIGLVGCMAQNYKESAFERSPAVDFVVGPADIGKIPEIIKKIEMVSNGAFGERALQELKIWETDGAGRNDAVYHSGFYNDKEHAFVVISEGCSNFCSYCVVPYARGALRHRDSADIIKEIEEAVEAGITKVTLLGQNVNAYKEEGKNFIELLKSVNNIKGIKEFGFFTSHPKDTSVELFKAIAELDKIEKCLHLPMQSGSDKILKLMNRGYTKKFYLDLALNYRKIVKGGVLSTDIIVGFPGETEEDFQETYNLVKNIGFNFAYIFKYSPRPHTEALKFADDVTKTEKERRHSLVLELQKENSKRLKI